MAEEQENYVEQPAAATEEGILRSENEALRGELKQQRAVVDRLEESLAGKVVEIAALEQSLAAVERNLAEMGKQMVLAVASYRDMVVQANPGVLAELITGETVEDVNETLKTARALVDRVRQEVEAEVARARIPAGSPQRTPPDVSALSSREKIQYAIGGSA